MTNRLPRWIWWAGAILGLWVGWTFIVWRPLTRQTAGIRQQCTESVRGCEKLIQGIASIPAMVRHRDSVYTQLRVIMDKFITTDHLDNLVRQLNRQGHRLGLQTVRSEPELVSLLETTASRDSLKTAPYRLDTVKVELMTEGPFKAVGRWLDRIEARRDFRYWMFCRWTSGENDGAVRLEAQAAFLVVSPEMRADKKNTGGKGT